MLAQKRIQEVYINAKRIPYDGRSKFVLMSDVHRGDGNGADDFFKNVNLYSLALRHYYDNNYTYIELGDGDELWENKSFPGIVDVYSGVFKALMKFHEGKRLHFIYGNHDSVKKKKKWVVSNLYTYFDKRKNAPVPLFPGVEPCEGIRLEHRETGEEILLLHGHQADFFNDTLGPLSKFLVRHLWRPLQLIGVRDPTSASGNHIKKLKIEEHMRSWVERQHTILIAGHTHRSMFPAPGDTPYFNGGCCVHPQRITALEIENNRISLVKWSVAARNDGVLYIGRNIVQGPQNLTK